MALEIKINFGGLQKRPSWQHPRNFQYVNTDIKKLPEKLLKIFQKDSSLRTKSNNPRTTSSKATKQVPNTPARGATST